MATGATGTRAGRGRGGGGQPWLSFGHGRGLPCAPCSTPMMTTVGGKRSGNVTAPRTGLLDDDFGEDDAAFEGDVVAHPVQPRVGVPHRGVRDDAGEDVADQLPGECVVSDAERRGPQVVDGEAGVYRLVLVEDRVE